MMQNINSDENLVNIDELAQTDTSQNKIVEFVTKKKIFEIQQVSSVLYEDILTSLARMGYPIHQTSFIKDSVLIDQSVRSALFRIYNIPHSLQKYADKNIVARKCGDESEDVAYIFTPEIKMVNNGNTC